MLSFVINRFLRLLLLLSLQLLLLLKHLILEQFALISLRLFLLKLQNMLGPFFGLKRLLCFEQCFFLLQFLLPLCLLLSFQFSFLLFVLLAG